MTCKVGALLLPGRMRAGDRRYLGDQLDASPRDVPATKLAKALTLEGHPVSATAVKDHRRGDCACARGVA